MFVVNDKIVSTELFSQKFICNLSKCKGACCWEGDFGAPVTLEEKDIIENVLDKIMPKLSEESQFIINRDGVASYNNHIKGMTTSLHENGACVFLVKDEGGIAKCAFEQAYEAEEISFKKPISCHLYPVRISQNQETNFEALNYDEWEICSAACSLGEEHQMPVFRFVKDAIIRQYGSDFYEQMEDIYQTFFT